MGVVSVSKRLEFFCFFLFLLGQSSYSLQFAFEQQDPLKFESLRAEPKDIFIDEEVNLFDLWAYQKQVFDQLPNLQAKKQAYIDANHSDLYALMAYQPRLNSGRHSTLAGSVSFLEARELLQLAQFHPISSPYMVANWDPEGKIGFCFGRAMSVDLEARFRGLDRNSIGKAWAVGPMKLGTSEWGWHVTSLVFSKEFGWLAIDPIYNDVVPIANWVENMWQANEAAMQEAKYHQAPQHLRVFFTRSGRFDPSGVSEAPLGRHVQAQIKSDFYNGYFSALIEFNKTISQIARQFLNSADIDQSTRDFYSRKPGQLRPSSLIYLALDPEFMEEAIAPLREAYIEQVGSIEAVEYEVPSPRSP